MTNLKEIKRLSKWLFDAFPVEEIEELKGLGIVSHPYTTMMFSMNKQHKFLDFTKPDDLKEFRDIIFNLIDSANDISRLYMLINAPYKLLWFSTCSSYMDNKDYGNYLADCWVGSENPNQDINVSLPEVVELFRDADKEYLMGQDELDYYNNLDSSITVYRGVSPGRVAYGLSWTDDIDKARWFKKRFETQNKKGILLKAEIKKENVLAYLNSRNEKELVVDVFEIADKIKEI